MHRDCPQTGDLSVKGISDALLRVDDACRNEYIAIQNHIRRSKLVHIDETGFHVNGKKFWLWALRSAENDVLITIVDCGSGPTGWGKNNLNKNGLE